MTTFTKSGLYLPSKAKSIRHKNRTVVLWQNFPEQVEAATSTCYWKNSPLYNGNIRFDEKKIVADSLFFQTMGIEVLSGNPVKDLQQPDVIFLSDRFAKKIFGHDFEVAQALGVRCVLQTAGHQSAQQLRATGAPVVPDVLAAAQYCLNEL